jgi:2-(1,2-epoxy-1,2-dihydrophenyl)acetyl-CoA isomerase
MEPPVSAEAELRRDGSIAIVLLNRPRRLNALDMEMARQLQEHLQVLALDKNTAAILITGTGRAFCAGGDLAWASSQPDGVPPALHVLAGHLHQSLLEIHGMDKPVIAAVNGIAAGAGFSLALACDFRVLDEEAVLRQAYTSAGLSINGGGTFMLPRLVGTARALEIAAFDQSINAEAASQLGLATRVAEQGASLDGAREMAAELSAGSLESFAASKRLLRRSLETPLETQLERERAAIVACAAGPEGHEGVNAFIGKRRPDFPRARR